MLMSGLYCHIILQKKVMVNAEGLITRSKQVTSLSWRMQRCDSWCRRWHACTSVGSGADGDYERLKLKSLTTITRNSEQQSIYGAFMPMNAIHNINRTKQTLLLIRQIGTYVAAGQMCEITKAFAKEGSSLLDD